MPASSYSASKWYWIVAASTTQVFYSFDFSFKPIANAAYVAWLAQGNLPSRVGSAGELATIIFQQIEPYFLNAGVAVTSTATPALNATYSMSDTAMGSLSFISSLIANAKGLPSGTSTFLYADVSGSTKTFTSPNILNLASALTRYQYAWEQAILTKVAGGTASFPTIPVTIA